MVGKKTIQTVLLVLSAATITEIIEPSAGAGAFMLEIENTFNIPATYYDLYPEHTGVTRQDFLKLDLPYKPGRIFIGNPPFGKSSYLWKKFVHKANEAGDYYAFISPVSQYYYNKENLLYSENLGSVLYDGESRVKVKTQLNIYKRGVINDNRELFDRIDRDFRIRGVKRNKDGIYENDGDYDFYIVAWGCRSSIGRLHYKKSLAGYFGINVLNKDMYRNAVSFFEQFNEKYGQEIRDMCLSAATLHKTFLCQKMWDELYK
jgi:hypothetical protein